MSGCSCTHFGQGTAYSWQRYSTEAAIKQAQRCSSGVGACRSAGGNGSAVVAKRDSRSPVTVAGPRRTHTGFLYCRRLAPNPTPQHPAERQATRLRAPRGRGAACNGAGRAGASVCEMPSGSHLSDRRSLPGWGSPPRRARAGDSGLRRRSSWAPVTFGAPTLRAGARGLHGPVRGAGFGNSASACPAGTRKEGARHAHAHAHHAGRQPCRPPPFRFRRCPRRPPRIQRRGTGTSRPTWCPTAPIRAHR